MGLECGPSGTRCKTEWSLDGPGPGFAGVDGTEPRVSDVTFARSTIRVGIPEPVLTVCFFWRGQQR